MSDTILKLRNLSAGYGGKAVFEGADLEVGARDFVGIAGPNGGGKTTLLKVMLGLLRPTGGSVEYFRNGTPCNNLRMGYMPQQSQTDRSFPITVHEVVVSGMNAERKLFCRLTDEQSQRVSNAEERLGLSEIASCPIGQLSGGQRQRTLLARAVVSNPELLILDEPDAYIDTYFGRQLYALLDEMNARCAIMMVSHDVAAVMSHAKKTIWVNRSVESLADKNMPYTKP